MLTPYRQLGTWSRGGCTRPKRTSKSLLFWQYETFHLSSRLWLSLIRSLFLTGDFWKSLSELRPSWHPCRPQGRRRHNLRRWRRWSQLQKDSSSSPCDTTLTSTTQTSCSLHMDQSHVIHVQPIINLLSSLCAREGRLDSSENQVDETMFLLESYITSTQASRWHLFYNCRLVQEDILAYVCVKRSG